LTPAPAAPDYRDPLASGFYMVTQFSEPDGRRLIGGGFQTAVDPPSGVPLRYAAYSFAIERLNPDGAPDLGFNGTGFVTVPIWGQYGFADAFVVQPDGKIVVGGNAFDPSRHSLSCYPAFCGYYPALARLNADGSVDRSFNGTGVLVIAIGDANSGPGDVEEFGSLTGLELMPDGKILVYDGTTATARVNADGTLDASFVGTSQVAREYPRLVVEYYNASLDHYFMTWLPKEIAALDAGTLVKNWTRTGGAFKTETTSRNGMSPVCRFYLPPPSGDSHFYGRGPGECDATAKMNPSFVLESSAFMQTALPAAGVCPAKTMPVYRLFNNRRDVNHRYTTDRAIRDQMVARGWLAEGEGPDRIVMCAPQ